MATKTTRRSNRQKTASDDSQQQSQISSEPKSKADRRKPTKASTKKLLSRQEKLEAARKANQAMMKAWELISQRSGNGTDAKSNV